MFVYSPLKCVFIFTKAGGNFSSKICNIYRNQYKFYSNKLLKNNEPLSVLFFGTDEFALQSLKALNESYRQKQSLYRLEVVTAYKGETNSVIQYAQEQRLIIHSWPPEINKKEFEIGVVVSFGHLIPSKIINSFPLGMINVHGSLLPRWRGAAPICHALINGDTITGVSIMKIMPKRFDVGSIIAQKETKIDPNETYINLYTKLAKLGANVLIETMNKLPDVLQCAKLQNEQDATYAPKVTQEMSFIDWRNMNAENVYNLQRGLMGIQPLRTYFNNQIIKLLNIKVVTETLQIKFTQQKKPGLVIFNKKTKILYVSCKGNSWITVETIIIPGRRPQSAAAFGSGFILNQKEKSCIFNQK